MKFNLLIASSQLNSDLGKSLGTGTVEGLRHLADMMAACGIQGDIYDLPNGIRPPETASPFSLSNGFALNPDELNVHHVPELQQNHSLAKHLQTITATYRRLFSRQRTVSYTLKRTLLPWVLEECFAGFSSTPSEQRLSQFEEFKAASKYWLDEFALYEAYRENQLVVDDTLRDVTQPTVARFIQSHQEQIERIKYTQMLCFEQRCQVRADLNKQGIGLIVNLPFGVELESADVFFHPDVFDAQLQVGCSPEPEHGYPEQAWGIAAYRERSRGLKRYLEERMVWISRLGDGVFIDHMVGWCGQYVLPMALPVDGQAPYGHFLTEDLVERQENLRWFLAIVQDSGLRIAGEVAGDRGRLNATNAVIAELGKQRRDISAMAIPRWEVENEKLKPLRHYLPSTLVMVETHDTSTLLQYLLNKKGYNEDFESPLRILEFCRRVLALPFFLPDVPLQLEVCSESFWFEICRRLSEGTPSQDLVFTLPGLISILSATYRSPTIENNINVKPGTSGAVGNGWRNWSYFSPPLEVIEQTPDLKQAISRLGRRTYRPFHHFRTLDLPPEASLPLQVLYAKSGNRSVIGRSAEGIWGVIDISQLVPAYRFELELVIRNEDKAMEVWHRLDLSQLLDLQNAGNIHFQDLNGNRACYVYQAAELLREGLFIRLRPGQVHHFLVYPGQS